MPLDISRIVARLDELARAVPRGGIDEFEELRAAVRNADVAEIRRRVEVPRPAYDFMPALSRGALNVCHTAPAPPADFSVLATDGSFILPDRHSPAQFYLLNVGQVRLDYGAQPRAELRATPELHFGEEAFLIHGRFRVSEALLGAKRAARELAALAELAGTVPRPAVALQDGSLILWTLFSATKDEAVRNWVLHDFLDALGSLRERGIPVASYISYPGGDDVLDSLRIGACDFPPQGRSIDCAECRKQRKEPACGIIPRVTDRYLFEHIIKLAPGERSTLFASRSPILESYGDHAIHFFFLQTGAEIARVEVPAWVAADERQLDLVHAVIYDQCQRGRGYPPALQEAHERAVIQAEDRRVVERLVEQALARAGVVMTRGAKDASKRGRFV